MVSPNADTHCCAERALWRFSSTGLSNIDPTSMDWERLDDEDSGGRGAQRAEAGSSTYRLVGTVACLVVLGFFLIFNAIAIARIQADTEARIAVSEAATMLPWFVAGSALMLSV